MRYIKKSVVSASAFERWRQTSCFVFGLDTRVYVAMDVFAVFKGSGILVGAAILIAAVRKLSTYYVPMRTAR